MPQRKELFENGEIYHITTRRIGDELLFKNIDDYYRGIFSIYEFNTINLVAIRSRRIERKREKENRVPDTVIAEKRDKLVEVLAFCLMPNHIHLLVRQLKEGGISKFMNKFGSGYSRYFKDKHGLENRGYFFQARFNSVHVETEKQLKTVFVYIHTNPAALIYPGWKERGIKNSEKVIKFLEDYKWSSYQDYIGKKNFPSVIEKEYLLEIMGGEKECKKFVNDWVRFKGEIKEFSEIALED